MTERDYLKEDDVINGQKYVILSLAAPEFVQKSDKPMVIFHGLASSEQEVQTRIQYIHSKHQNLNIYHAPIGKWLPWCDGDVSPEKQLELLQTAVKEHINNKLHEDEKFTKRRDELKSNMEATTETVDNTGGAAASEGEVSNESVNKTENSEEISDSSELLRDHEKYVCLTFIETKEVRGIKVRGVYNTEEKANEESKKLQEKCMCDIRDKYFDINVAEMGRWLPFDTNLDNIETHYADNNLNELMQNYQKNQVDGHNHLAQMESDKLEDEMKKSLFETDENKS